ncbi:hypothetical protein [Wenyingzhuangia sp. IMCC45467]
MKKHTILITLLLFTIHTLHAHREKTYYLVGKIDHKEVAFKIDEYGTDCVAVYTTINDKYDHFLEGNILEGGLFKLFSKHWDKEKKANIVNESIEIREVEKNLWEGVWKKKNKEINFSLKPIDVDKLKHKYINAIKKHDIDPYTAYKTKNIKFKKRRKEEIAKGAYIRKYVDKKSDISFFRVVNNPTHNIEPDSINLKLTAIHLKMIGSKYSCVFQGEIGEYTTNYKVNYLTSKFLSYTSNIHRSCFGSAGNDAIEHITYNMENAIEPKLEELFWFGKQPMPKLSKGEYKWMQYRYKVFGPKILEILTAIYPEKINENQNAKCDYNNVKNWQFPLWYLTKDGLLLKKKNNNDCDYSWSIIPYKHLTAYTNSQYNFVE